MAYAGIGRFLIRLAPYLTEGAWEIYQLTEKQDAPENFRWYRCQASISRDTGEDLCINTFDFVNITDGVVDSSWITSDFTTVEGRLNTFYNAVKGNMSQAAHSVTYRWYLMPRTPGVENPPVSRITVGIADLAPVGDALPNQIAQTLTKVTALRRHWGRIYLGPLSNGMMGIGGATGMFDATKVGANLTAFEALRAGCQADDFPMVVYDRAKSALHTVIGSRSDNVPDVQRRRRPSQNVVRSLAGAQL